MWLCACVCGFAGVNDAPALKEADCGVAMGITGTDVAKQAAKMILADDLFATIAEAVRQGRGVYDNLQKVLLFALPTNFAQGFSIAAALVIGMPEPLTAMQVLTVNMVTSVTLGIVVALGASMPFAVCFDYSCARACRQKKRMLSFAERPEPDVMNRPPRPARAQLLNKFIAWRTFYVSLLAIVAMLGNYQWGVVGGQSAAQSRAMTMATLVIFQCIYVLNCRFVLRTAFTRDIFIGNPWVFVMIVLNAGILCFLMYTPGVQVGSCFVIVVQLGIISKHDSRSMR